MSKKFRLYRDGDIEEINPHMCYSGDPLAALRVQAVAEATPELVFTIVGSDEKPLAIMGWCQAFSRVAEIWAYTDARVIDDMFRFCKATKELVDSEFSRNDSYNRMQITMLADQPWSEHWASFLGFEKEGRLKKYGEECADYFMFARVREDKCSS